MEELTIEVQKREETGDGACRRLRRAGWVPGVVYGGGRDPLPIQIERKPLLEILAKGAGRTGSSCSGSPAPTRAGTR